MTEHRWPDGEKTLAVVVREALEDGADTVSVSWPKQLKTPAARAIGLDDVEICPGCGAHVAFGTLREHMYTHTKEQLVDFLAGTHTQRAAVALKRKKRRKQRRAEEAAS